MLIMKVIVGNPWDIAKAIEKENVSTDRVIQLLRCSVLIINRY